MSTENYDKTCQENYGFELKEAYKLALKFYKGKSRDLNISTFWDLTNLKILQIWKVSPEWKVVKKLKYSSWNYKG